MSTYHSVDEDGGLVELELPFVQRPKSESPVVVKSAVHKHERHVIIARGYLPEDFLLLAEGVPDDIKPGEAGVDEQSRDSYRVVVVLKGGGLLVVVVHVAVGDVCGSSLVLPRVPRIGVAVVN